MKFLTENDIRAKMQHSSGKIHIGKDEKLTPSASEYARSQGYSIVIGEERPVIFEHASSLPIPDTPIPEKKEEPTQLATDATCKCRPEPGRTFLDANTQVLKSHPRIELRGRLDTLIAEIILVQTRFDQQNKQNGLLKNGLNDIKNWLWRLLASEISGEEMPKMRICGISDETAHEISLNPKKFLGIDPIVPDASYGADVAYLNWIRARVREVEVLLAKIGAREDLMNSCNCLSSAVYVLMLLTIMASMGKDISQFAKTATGK